MKKLNNILVIFFIWIALSANGQQENLMPGQHKAQISSGKIWYHVLGDGKAPYILMLHGGPGGTSRSLYALSPLSDDYTLIFLDQPGTGRSGNMKDTSQMKIDYFVELLNEFTDTLKLNNFVLYGHSWGTMLGLDYYLTHPEKVEALILNSPLASTRRWILDADTLIATLHDSIQRAIEIHEKQKTYNHPEYRNANRVYYEHFIRRGERLPMPEFPKRVPGNRLMYMHMWGPSEFNSTGNLKNYDRIDRLCDIKVPTLWVTGEFDEARPNTVRYYHTLTPGSEFKMIPGAAHATMIDNQEENVRVIRNFLDRNVINKNSAQRNNADGVASSGETLNSDHYHQLRSGLKNSQIIFEQEKKGKVAFLGGSITYNPGWRDSVSAYLVERFPGTDFEFIKAGIPSMGSTSDAFRLQRDVLSHGKIDLLFFEAAVNDASKGRTSIEQIRGMEGVVRHLRNTNPSIDIVMMHFVDPRKISDYNKGIEPEVITNHNKVAKRYDISVINLAKEVTDRIQNNEFTWEDDFKNLHPSPFGQGIYAHSMIQFLQNAYSGQIPAGDKISLHSLPEKIDPYPYDNGDLIDISEAKARKGWQIDPSWNPRDGKKTRDNYVDVPMLIATDPGSRLKLKFKGNCAGIVVAAGPDAGYIEYRIDRGEWRELNLFTRYSGGLHLPWYYTLATELTESKHLLEIRIAEEKDERSTGNACRIRYFYTNNF